MAPFNFEEQIKEHLEARNIKPSKSAWTQLESQLEVVQKQTSKERYWLLGMAASFVGVLFISTLFFTPNAITRPAGSEINSVDHKTLPEYQKTEVVTEQPFNADDTTREQSVKILKTPVYQDSKLVFSKDQIKQQNLKRKRVETNKTVGSLVVAIENKEQPNAATLEDEKVNAVVEAIKKMKDHQEVVTNEEIEALLKKAQNDLRYHSMYQHATKTVDAMVLLEAVEADLERSFREKVFEALLSSYETVKTAVAQRND